MDDQRYTKNRAKIFDRIKNEFKIGALAKLAPRFFLGSRS